MKSYTDIEQSKKLAKILPLESADMHYWKRTWKENDYAISVGHSKEWQEGFESKRIEYIPCWSLMALLNSVKYNTINLHYNDVRNDWIASCTLEHSTRYESGRALNPVDACYEMIIKLHKQNLL